MHFVLAHPLLEPAHANTVRTFLRGSAKLHTASMLGGDNTVPFVTGPTSLTARTVATLERLIDHVAVAEQTDTVWLMKWPTIFLNLSAFDWLDKAYASTRLMDGSCRACQRQQYEAQINTAEWLKHHDYPTFNYDFGLPLRLNVHHYHQLRQRIRVPVYDLLNLYANVWYKPSQLPMEYLPLVSADMLHNWRVTGGGLAGIKAVGVDPRQWPLTLDVKLHELLT